MHCCCLALRNCGGRGSKGFADPEAFFVKSLCNLRYGTLFFFTAGSSSNMSLLELSVIDTQMAMIILLGSQEFEGSFTLSGMLTDL